MSLNEYLIEHFVQKAAFAHLAGISLERLDELLAADAVPKATYKSDGRSIVSSTFGEIEGHESVAGEYFRPECVRWTKIADQAPTGLERSSVLDTLVAELRGELASYGFSNPEIEELIEDCVPSFFDGTFGLCVADPSGGAGIARKETLQAKLTKVTANGSNPSPEGMTRDELLQLIDDYAAAAMPFSPAEYPRSSRKRLVDDLRPIVADS